jgi:hypothetical protein
MTTGSAADSIGLVGLNTVTAVIAGRDGSTDAQGPVTAFSEVQSHLLCQLGQPGEPDQVYRDYRLGPVCTV